MDTAALIIACFGAVVAVLSLGWQIAAWMMEGRRVRVDLKHGAMGHNGFVVGAVERSGKPRDLSRVIAEGFTGREVLGITVTNIGRAPVTVTRYSAILIRGALSFSPIAIQIGPAFPFRLQPGESESWYADMLDVNALVHAAAAVNKRRKIRRKVCMAVELGTGDIKKTRRHLSVSGI
jgi:hypothetical protein